MDYVKYREAKINRRGGKNEVAFIKTSSKSSGCSQFKAREPLKGSRVSRRHLWMGTGVQCSGVTQGLIIFLIII